jgi:GNAT superfamily N-acetyltransferase
VEYQHSGGRISGRIVALQQAEMRDIARRAIGLIGACRMAGLAAVGHAARVRLSEEQRFIRFALGLDQASVLAAPGPFIEVREGVEALRGFRRRHDGPLPIQFVFDEVKGARRPYLGCWEGEVGHVSWLFAHDDPAGRVRRLDLLPGEIEIDGCFTFAEFRGRGLFPAVLRTMLDGARRDGVVRAYMHVAENNVSSIRAVEKVGFQPVAAVTSRWFLGVHQLRVEHALPVRVLA